MRERVGLGVAGVGTEDRVDDVQDAVGEEEVLLDDAGLVDEEGVGDEGDRYIVALEGLECRMVVHSAGVVWGWEAVGEVGGVEGRGVGGDDVVLEETGEIVDTERGEGRGDVLESLVSGGEDGEGGADIGVVCEDGRSGEEGAGGGGEVEGGRRGGEVLWRDEDSVDYVHDAVVVCQVLEWFLRKGCGNERWGHPSKRTLIVRVEREPRPVTATETFPACSTTAMTCPPVTLV